MSKKKKARSRNAGREQSTQENKKEKKDAGKGQSVPESGDLVWILPEEIAAEGRSPGEQPGQPETGTGREGEPQKGRLLRTAGEVLYNCPYLLALCLTCAVALFVSDEIGIRAIAAAGSSSESAVPAVAGDSETTEEGAAPASDQTENPEENKDQESENAGERKEENGNKEIETEQYTDDETPEPIENTENAETGITKYEFYDPIATDSPYYSDAGKVALTTEYPYAKENDSYFNDAAFLGDSRTLGISDYAGLDGADFYCDSGMMIFKLLEEDGVTYQRTGQKVNLSQVLREKHYGKIYIMLGMNELGYGNTVMYLDKYREVVEQIRQWQPGAVIYIMANLHISEAKNNMETEFNNININDKNAAAASLANGKDIFYLDANPLFTDENGFLKAELTFDGVHLYAQHYDVWREFLMEHAVEAGAGQAGDSEDGSAEAE